MADEYKNLRRIQATTRSNLTTELKTKMLGFDSTTKALGFKNSAGVMSWYTPEGGSATFDNLTLSGFLGSTGMLAINGSGQVVATSMGAYGASMSVGAVAFDGLAINADTTKFDMGAVKAFFVDHTVPENPIVTYQEFPAQTAIAVTNLLTSPATYVGIDSAGTIFQSSTELTPSQKRTYCCLGVIVHSNKTIINAVNNLPCTTLNPTNQLGDLMTGIGAFVISGNQITANGSNLRINKSGGTLFKAGSNFVTDSTNPHILTLAGLTAPDTIRYRTQDGDEDTDTQVIDPSSYDNAGTKTTIPSTGWTVQRVFLFSSNLLRIQYGQKIYATKTDALNSIGKESPAFITEPNIAANGTLISYLVLNKTCNNLSDTAKCEIIQVGKFGTILGSASASIDTLQSAYDNSSEPEIITNETLRAVSIKNGQLLDAQNQFEIKNKAGDIKTYIDAAGTIYTDGALYANTIYLENNNTISNSAQYGLEIDLGGGYTSVARFTKGSDVVLDINNSYKLSLLGDTDIPTGKRYLKNSYQWTNEYNGNESTYYDYGVTEIRTVTFNSGGTSVYWINGVRYTAPTNLTVQHTTDIGVHYIYINSSNALVTSMVPWDLTDPIVPITTVYQGGPGVSAAIPLFECHNHKRDLSWHANAHTSIGTQAQVDGFALTNINPGDTTPTTAELKLGISQGWLKDEDIKITLPALAYGGDTYNIFRRSAPSPATSLVLEDGHMPFGYGPTYIKYNNVATGTMVEASGTNKYVNYFVVACQANNIGVGSSLDFVADSYTRFLFVPGQKEHSRIDEARAEEFWSLSLGDLNNFPEWVPLYRITYKTGASYTLALGQCRVEEYKRYYVSRGSINGVASSIAPAPTLGNLAGSTANAIPYAISTTAHESTSTFVFDPATGRLGIGTATPTTVLDIISTTTGTSVNSQVDEDNVYATSSTTKWLPQGSRRFMSYTLPSDAGQLNGFAGYAMGVRSVYGYMGLVKTSNVTGFEGAICFGMKTGSAAYSEYMRIDHTGKVGIGTATPSYLLHMTSASVAQGSVQSRLVNSTSSGSATYVTNVTGASTMAIGSTGTGYNPTIIYDRANCAYFDYTGAGGVSIAAANASGIITFHTDASGTERMRIAADGNVGIGRTASAQRLEVQGGINGFCASNVSTEFFLYDDASKGVGIFQYGSGVSGTLLTFPKATTVFAPSAKTFFAYTSTAVDYVIGTNNAERMRIASDGKVGIGTTTPTYALDIAAADNGGVRILGTNATTYYRSQRSNGASVYFGGQLSDGLIGTESNHPLKVVTNDTLALTIGTDQSATFASRVTVVGADIQLAAAATAIQTSSTFTLTPSYGTSTYTQATNGSTSINLGTISADLVGRILTFVFSPTGTFTITFGTKFTSQGTITTTNAKKYVVTFLVLTTTSVIEMSRTAAM